LVGWSDDNFKCYRDEYLAFALKGKFFLLLPAANFRRRVPFAMKLLSVD
jgi:hypothetical protein